MQPNNEIVSNKSHHHKDQVDESDNCTNTRLPTYRVVHLVVASDVFVQCSQHDHCNHARQEQYNHHRVQDAANINNTRHLHSQKTQSNSSGSSCCNDNAEIKSKIL